MKLFNNSGQRGFTLIELIVVIAILGTLSAIAVPLVTSYLSNSKARAYDAEQSKIQAAVNLYYGAKGNSRFIGKRVYPVLGKDQTTKSSLNTQTTTLNMIDDACPSTPRRQGSGAPTAGPRARTWRPQACGSTTAPTASETSAPLPAQPTAGTVDGQRKWDWSEG
jgi:prepilin-type N-terminal cleavage/methylation domain-containing protein